jgi:hypothetical protein
MQLNGGALMAHDDEKVYALVLDLIDPNTREAALLELSKKREQYDDLALVLWHSFGSQFCLLSMNFLSLLTLSLHFTLYRYYADFTAGNRLSLSITFPA